MITITETTTTTNDKLAPYVDRLNRIGARAVARRARRSRVSSPDAALFFSRTWNPNGLSDRELEINRVERDAGAYVDRVAIRELAWEIYALGGLPALTTCCAELESDQVISYIEECWDGVGLPAVGQFWQ